MVLRNCSRLLDRAMSSLYRPVYILSMMMTRPTQPLVAAANDPRGAFPWSTCDNKPNHSSILACTENEDYSSKTPHA